MHNQYLFKRITLLALLLLGFTWRTHSEEFQYVNAVVSSLNTTNNEMAIDNSDVTAATLTIPFLAAEARLRLAFGSVVRVGGQGRLLIQVPTNLDVSAFNSITIRTYMGSDTVAEESFPLSTLISITTLTGGVGKNTVQFPVGKAFNQVELSISGTVNANVSINLFLASATFTSPLPVELVAFQARSTSAGTALAWNTASERNCDYFVVERADSSPENFRALRQVQGAGTTTHPTQYTFVDAHPALLNYYRLRQVDSNGTTSFSPVVFVKNTASKLPLAVYPSPATETVVVTGAVGTRFALFDQLGRQLHTGEVLAGTRPTLDVRALPGGVYFVRDLATGSSRRFVKVAAE
jgi:hypothetical protein